VPQYRWASPVVTWHSRATQIRLASISHRQKICSYFPFFKKFGRSQRLHAKDLLKFSKSQCPAGLTNTKRKDNRRRLCLDLAKNLSIYLGLSYLHKSKSIMTQTTTTTTTRRHQEGCGQPKEGPVSPMSLSLGAPGSIGHPPDHPLGSCCFWT
jgi:hypothetical protein